MAVSQSVLICYELLQIESNSYLRTEAKLIAIRSTLMAVLWLRSYRPRANSNGTLEE